MTGARERTRLARRRGLGLATLAATIFSVSAQPAIAQDGGPGGTLRIDGRVLHAIDSTGAVGVEVELHRVTRDSGGVADRTRSGADGSFRFRRDEPEGSSAVFVVSARYGGIRYFGPPMHAGTQGSGEYDVLVYDTLEVSSPPDLSVGVRHLLITPDPGAGDLVDVAEVIDVGGRPDRTIVPTAEASAVWVGRLPPGARGATVVPGGLPADQVSIDADRVLVRAPVPPTGVRLTIRYRVPVGRLEVPIDHPTRHFELLIAGGDVEASVDGLAGGEALDVSGLPYRRFSGSSLTPGTKVGADLTRRAPGRTGAWLWLLAGGVLLAAALGTWRWRGAS
ncbi:MAG: hypothetical protein ACE5HF_05595 [Gemmatimonadota bacterium]